MPTQVNEVVCHLRRIILPKGEFALTDGELLGRFIEHRDEAAVTALVRRHGPMVWGVCRRILRNHHDAEDAFQATFLVLVRKAGSVRQRELVGNWLYGVAHQTAMKARATTGKRRRREMQVMALPEVQAPEQDSAHELEPFLDQELSRLPDKYRVAIVLCDLEGKTRKEAARQLGLPEGTLAGRLTRGRAMLAKRLARRGLAMSGGSLAAVLPRKAASAGVPASVMTSTIKAVTLVAAGQAVTAGVVSARIAALTEGVLKAMLISKLKTVAGAFLAAGLIGVVAASSFPRAAATPGVPPGVQQQPKAGKAAQIVEPAARKLFAGVWQVASIEDDAKNSLDFDPILSHACGIQAPVRVTRFTFRGDKFVLKTGPVSLQGSYALDPSGIPKKIWLSIPMESPDGQGIVSVPGEYSLDGDNLSIRCTDLPPSQPAALAGGKAGVCYTLRREAEQAAARERPPAPQGPVARVFGDVTITREELGNYLIRRMTRQQLQAYVNRRILEHAAQKAKVTVTAEELERAVAAERKDLGVEGPAFEELLRTRVNKSLAEWKEDVVWPRLILEKLSRGKVSASERFEELRKEARAELLLQPGDK
jgi:RNA polymerase sigma factor (sigma-70 family)